MRAPPLPAVVFVLAALSGCVDGGRSFPSDEERDSATSKVDGPPGSLENRTKLPDNISDSQVITLAWDQAALDDFVPGQLNRSEFRAPCKTPTSACREYAFNASEAPNGTFEAIMAFVGLQWTPTGDFGVCLFRVKSEPCNAFSQGAGCGSPVGLCHRSYFTQLERPGDYKVVVVPYRAANDTYTLQVLFWPPAPPVPGAPGNHTACAPKGVRMDRGPATVGAGACFDGLP